MGQYRKRPVVVEAWRWLYTAEQEPEPEWVRNALNRWPDLNGVSPEFDHPDGPRMAVATVEGVAILLPGNWLVRGVEGELYPCRADIFEATYQPALGDGAGDERLASIMAAKESEVRDGQFRL